MFRWSLNAPCLKENKSWLLDEQMKNNIVSEVGVMHKYNWRLITPQDTNALHFFNYDIESIVTSIYSFYNVKQDIYYIWDEDSKLIQRYMDEV